LHPRGVRSWPSMLGLDASRQPSLTQLSYGRELLFRLEFRLICWRGLYPFGFDKVSAGLCPAHLVHCTDYPGPISLPLFQGSLRDGIAIR